MHGERGRGGNGRTPHPGVGGRAGRRLPGHRLPGGQRRRRRARRAAGQGPTGRRRTRLRAQPGRAHPGHPAQPGDRRGRRRTRGPVLLRPVLRPAPARHQPRTRRRRQPDGAAAGRGRAGPRADRPLPGRRPRRRRAAVLAAPLRPHPGDRPAPRPAVRGRRTPRLAGAESDRDLVYIDNDNRGGARLAVQHLRSLGRERIATITGPLDQTSSIDRLDGYRDLLPDGDEDLIAVGDFTADGGTRAMTELLDRRPDLDAVFAASDSMASGAIRALRAAGRRIPEDVAVVGFDDVESIAAWTEPPLTTVRQEIEEMGRLMTRQLLRRLNDPAASAPSSVIIPTHLVVRESA
ncbi:LacI family transcriptional regulator [Kitasatospora cheerisanensis KCTC 2395]|uniref:LacI family transcriptional regulator n=1 Tax=Kitasatospora cheerisanensis KCTC 2395 TaxID=1348663 RepID=A0A066YGW6_9ACTN|nr:LacI family transcriptional regulator [Kitasatospora cheerisanensis KCTC 2395]